jgi:hypothetical protein
MNQTFQGGMGVCVTINHETKTFNAKNNNFIDT